MARYRDSGDKVWVSTYETGLPERFRDFVDALKPRLDVDLSYDRVDHVGSERRNDDDEA